jgi:Cd2+/Zn2+-exporting ATPase/Cu+-exporting ATPase
VWYNVLCPENRGRFTLIVDGVGVGLAAFGLLNPLLAAFIHVASELTFILNSARLLPVVSRRRSPGIRS